MVASTRAWAENAHVANKCKHTAQVCHFIKINQEQRWPLWPLCWMLMQWTCLYDHFESLRLKQNGFRVRRSHVSLTGGVLIHLTCPLCQRVLVRKKNYTGAWKCLFGLFLVSKCRPCVNHNLEETSNIWSVWDGMHSSAAVFTQIINPVLSLSLTHCIVTKHLVKIIIFHLFSD